MNDRPDPLRVQARPPKAECCAPIVEHEDDPVAQVQSIPQREKIFGVLGQTVAIGPGVRELVRRAQADEVAGDEPASPSAAV